MIENKSGVSPVIGVFLLLGLTVGFVALTSNILFSSVDQAADPTADIEVTHNQTGSGDYKVNVLISRNQNIEEFSYVLDGTTCFIQTSNALESGESFVIPDDGTSCSASSVSEGSSVAIRGRVGGEVYVLQNYQIPSIG